jgi:hypothetical protein
VACALACHGADHADDEAAARAVVTRLFTAAVALDCDAVMHELGPTLRARFESAGCEESLEDFRAHPLEQIVSVAPDGRSPDAMLVRVRLSGQRTESVVRLRRAGDAWQIESM